MIGKLLIKKTKLGTCATSTVYKVRNIFTQKGFLCLKLLNNAVVSQGNENETKKAKKRHFGKMLMMMILVKTKKKKSKSV